MLKHYFKIAWRNILRYRFYSLVNIIGLSTGIAFTFLIGGYVWKELQVNKNLKNADRQFIIQSKWKDPDMGNELTTIGALPKALHDQYPNLVSNYYRWDGITSTVSSGDKHYREGLQIVDTTFLSMYGFPLLYGNAKNAFDNPYSVIITEAKARKYFGRADVVGEPLTIESFSGTKHDFIITAVLKNLSQNSVTKINAANNAEIFLPETCIGFFGRTIDHWNNQVIVGYVELQKGVAIADLEAPVHQLLKQNASPAVNENLKPLLIPLSDFYLNSSNGLVKKMLYALTFIALFILFMAIINFINISISKSASRMREIGVRKVLGGLRKQLLQQFLAESILLVFFSALFALIIYQLSRTFFSAIVGTEIPQLYSFPPVFVLIPIVITLVVGFVAGIYPAVMLSSLKSVDSLKGKFSQVKEGILLRKSLIGFQFCIATVVFIAAIIVSQQINFLFSNDLGYNKNYVLTAQVPRDWSAQGVAHMETLRDEFARMPQVNQVTLSYEIPNGNNGGANSVYKFGEDSLNTITIQTLVTDEKFASTYRIPMVAGEFMNASGGRYDSASVVINEAAAKVLNLDPHTAVGNKVMVKGNPGVFTIAGVIKDFHFGSMQGPIQPTWFVNVKSASVYRYLSFRLNPGDLNSSITALEKKWSELMPGAPLEYNFMDDTLRKLYQSELQLKKAAYTATILALIIVLLGVLGLISLSIQKRRKEIGIRKVLGATAVNIVRLLSLDFVQVVGISTLVAFPIAWIIMNQWLQHYAYRITMSGWVFVLAGISALAITLVTVSFQTIRAALVNPVKNLRME